MDLLNAQLDVVFKLLLTRDQQLLLAMLEAVLAGVFEMRSSIVG